MRNYWILARLQLSSLFGINKALHSRDPETKKKSRRSVTAFLVMVVALLYISTLYSGIMASVLAPMGMLPALIGVMAMATILLVLLFSVFETRSLLFGFGSADTMLSWPVSTAAIAAGRITSMYVYNLVYALLFLLPAGVVYGVATKASWLFYASFVALLLFVPALPTILGALLGALIAAATARMKHKSVLSSVIQILFACGIMFASLRLNSFDDQLGGQVASLAARIRSLCPPAAWFQNATTGGNVGAGLLLVASSLLALALLLYWMAKRFTRISAQLTAAPRSEAFHMRAQTRSSCVRALYRKEWKRYLSSSSYVTNTAFGYVLLLAMAVVLGFVRPDGVMQFLSIAELPGLRMCIPLFLAWIVVMSATTSSSISLEGKWLWQIKCMPVSARHWLLSKLLVSLTFAVPCILVCSSVIAIGLRASAAETVCLITAPLCFALLAGVGGLWINIRSYRFDWQNDMEIVKQSAPTMLAVFLGMAICFLPLGLTVALAKAWIVPVCSVCALLLSALMWRNLMRTGDKRLYRM